MTNDESRALIESGRKHDEAMRSTAPTCKCNGAAECEDWRPRASWDDAYCKADTWFEANHRVLLDGYAAAMDELDHATAHDGDHLSKASRRMVDTVMGDRDALRAKVAGLLAHVDDAKRAAGDDIVSGEPLADYITRMRIEADHLRNQGACDQKEKECIHADAYPGGRPARPIPRVPASHPGQRADRRQDPPR